MCKIGCIFYKNNNIPNKEGKEYIFSYSGTYHAFYGFPGNLIEARYERYRRLSVGEAHIGHISRCGCHGTHTLHACLSCLGLTDFPGKP